MASLCDSETIIDRGHVQYTGSMAGLLETATGGKSEFQLTLAKELPGTIAMLSALQGIETVARDETTDAPSFRILFENPDPDTSPVLQAVLGRGGRIIGLQRVQKQLDEAFMDLTEPGVRS